MHSRAAFASPRLQGLPVEYGMRSEVDTQLDGPYRQGRCPPCLAVLVLWKAVELWNCPKTRAAHKGEDIPKHVCPPFPMAKQKSVLSSDNDTGQLGLGKWGHTCIRGVISRAGEEELTACRMQPWVQPGATEPQ